jgi:hypothetical protein
MSYYLEKLPIKKVEIFDEYSEFIGDQNIYTDELDWREFNQKYLTNISKQNKSLVCVLDNDSFDAAVVLENEYDVKRFCNIDLYDDYRPHYYFLVDNEFIKKWK